MNLKELSKDLSLDLWICHHFKCLPTEDRFKRLTDLQKQLLYTSWVELPSSDQIKKYYDKKSDTPVIGKEESKDFKKLGYTQIQIDKMKSELEKAGFGQLE